MNRIRKKLIVILFLMTVLVRPGFSKEVTEADFKVKTTRDIVSLCTASAGDPHANAAVHFCHGFLIGAYAYHMASISGPEGKRMFCLPEPEPSRNDAIAMFLEWVKAHPQYMDQPPVETEFMFLIEKWPCKP
jgi:hypothetical protein